MLWLIVCMRRWCRYAVADSFPLFPVWLEFQIPSVCQVVKLFWRICFSEHTFHLGWQGVMQEPGGVGCESKE